MAITSCVMLYLIDCCLYMKVTEGHGVIKLFVSVTRDLLSSHCSACFLSDDFG